MADVKCSPNCKDELFPATKSKQHIKLWDSFLRKTRKIRVRTKEKSTSSPLKLEKRALSHPNISSYAAVSDITYTHNETTTSSARSSKLNVSLISEDLNGSREEPRRNRHMFQRGISRSTSRLHDSDGDLPMPVAKIAPRVSFESSDNNSDNNSDREYHSSYSHSVLTSHTQDHRIRNYVSTGYQHSKYSNNTHCNRDSSLDKDCVNGDDGADREVADKATPDTSGRSHNSTQISKSMDSLLTVASGIILPQVTAEHTSVKTNNRRSDKLFGNISQLGVTTLPYGQIRRHSYDTSTKNQREDSSEYFDCQEFTLDDEIMPLSLEPSPVTLNSVVNTDFTERQEDNKVGCLKPPPASLSDVAECLRGEKVFLNAETNLSKASKVTRQNTSYHGVAEDHVSRCSHVASIINRQDQSRDPSPTVPANEPETQQYSAFMLNIHLKEGRDLVIRDTCGTSDPYVKFIIGNKVMYKSRIIFKNLNPCWDEHFTIPVDDITKSLLVKVFDYDRAWSDDPMGGADLDLTSIVMNKETELKVMLTEKTNEEYMGYLLLTCTLIPKLEENKELFFHRSTRSTDSKKIRMQLWNAVVNIVLVEGNNLVSMDDNGFSDPYVKFKLGLEKYRSKFKNKTLQPRWLEQFDLHLYEEQTSQLEIEVYDHDTRGKDDFMGRAVIDLSLLEKDKTHVIEQQLEDGAGTIKLLLTITGTTGSELTSDLTNYMPDAHIKNSIISKYGVLNSFTSLNDIGYLEVKVFRAHGLQAADFGGLSDPFCVLELINDRVQTHTEYKTLNPEWSKVFTFQVKDIHSVLEITVYDEDRNKKVEFLGKISIPLLKIRNNERRWYALKDRKMIHKMKGAILLEMNVVFNHIKAAIRTVNPREEKLIVPEDKFKISIMKENINRVSHLIEVFIDTGKFIQSCFDWQSPPRTIAAFIVYLVIVWNFELYMIPLSLLLIFMKNLLFAQISSSMKKEPVEDDYFADEDEDDDSDKDKEEKKSIIERYHAVQEVCLTVQQALDKVASLGERVKNTFSWSVPWLSGLAVIALLIGSIILYYIPLRYLLLLWGINKFTKKLRKPNAISNNELLDFLSRIPSDNELLQYRDLRPDIPANTSSKKKRS